MRVLPWLRLLLFLLLVLIQSVVFAAQSPLGWEPAWQGDLSAEQVAVLSRADTRLSNELESLYGEISRLHGSEQLERIHTFVEQRRDLFFGSVLRDRLSVFVLRRAHKIEAELEKIAPEGLEIRRRVWRVSIQLALNMASRTAALEDSKIHLDYERFGFDYAGALIRVANTFVHSGAQYWLIDLAIRFLQWDLARGPAFESRKDAILAIESLLSSIDPPRDSLQQLVAIRTLKKGFDRVQEIVNSDPSVSPAARSKVQKLILGGGFSCAHYRDGRVKCWGRVGDGSEGLLEDDPTLRIALAPTWLKKDGRFVRVESLLEDFNYGPALCGRVQNRLNCWGIPKESDFDVSLLKLVPNGAQVSLAHRYSCYLDSARRPWCWGRNIGLSGFMRDFSLGLLPRYRRELARPVRFRRLRGVRDIAVSNSAGCLIDREGKIACWGQYGSVVGKQHPGPVGDFFGRSLDTPRPRKVGQRRLRRVAEFEEEVFHQIFLRNGRACAIAGHQQDRLYCWGASYFSVKERRRSSDGVRYDFHPIRQTFFNQRILSLSLSVEAVCAILADGSVRCSGLFYQPEEVEGNFTLSPEKGDGSKFVQIAGSTTHHCALTERGNVFCWGSNDDQQVSPGGEPGIPYTHPVRVEGL